MYNKKHSMDKSNITILIKKLSLESDRAASPMLAPHGLTATQYKVIELLYSQPVGTVRQIDLQKALSVTNPTLTSILQNMEKDGWVIRGPNPQDRRSKIVSLTPRSYKLKEELSELGNQLERRFAKQLNPIERSILIKLLAKLLKDQN